MRHVNIPIFIPHEGCPNSCVFCDQCTITGENGSARRDIRPEIDRALETIEKDAEVEIAFFGGSFTGIGIPLMTSLCDAAYEYVKSGKASSVRLSTRPDYISEEILCILKDRGVTDIELGIQSMSQYVLDKSKRGHTVSDTEKACRLISEYGFNLVGQMMIGLPGSDAESEVMTAKRIAEMGAGGARIYPTVVFYGTELCSMAKSGMYTPLTTEQAVLRCGEVYKVFRKTGVEVLRIGLHSSEELSDASKVFAGANHPSLGELVIGEYYYSLVCERLCEIVSLLPENKQNENEKYRLCIYCAKGEESKLSGQKKVNRTRLLEKLLPYGYQDIKIISTEQCREKLFFSAENIR